MVARKKRRKSNDIKRIKQSMITGGVIGASVFIVPPLTIGTGVASVVSSGLVGLTSGATIGGGYQTIKQTLKKKLLLRKKLRKKR